MLKEEIKSELVKCMRMVDGRSMSVALNGKLVGKVDNFRYLGSLVAVNGELKFEMNEIAKVCGGMKKSI